MVSAAGKFYYSRHIYALSASAVSLLSLVRGVPEFLFVFNLHAFLFSSQLIFFTRS